MRSAAPDTDVDPPGLPLSVALIDDHAAPRHGLSLLLHAEGFDIVGEAGDVGAGIALLRDERPDLALVDLGDRSVALLSCARSRKLTARVLVFAAEGDASMLDDAMAAGAAGVLLKRASREDLVRALRGVASGGIVVDAHLARPDGPTGTWLTPRERELLALFADGATTESAANYLVISTETVSTHARNAMRRLGARTRAHAVAIALRDGLI